MASSPLLRIQAEGSLLAEFLEIFMILTFKLCQSSDVQMGFAPGYLAKKWQFTIRTHILLLKSYQEYPDQSFPKTSKQKLNSLKDYRQVRFFNDNIQYPFLKEAIVCVTEQGGSWLEFPKLLAAGDDERGNNLK